MSVDMEIYWLIIEGLLILVLLFFILYLWYRCQRSYRIHPLLFGRVIKRALTVVQNGSVSVFFNRIYSSTRDTTRMSNDPRPTMSASSSRISCPEFVKKVHFVND